MYKIGLSLLVALAFLLPSASALSGITSEKEKAGVNTGVDTGISINNAGAQAAGDVYIQVMNSPKLDGPDGHSVKGGCYPITVQIMNEAGAGPASVKAFVDIYHKTSGTEVVMYETSFEDNFDIYNNWLQIDADCGVVGGQYDSWHWTDARAYCDTHSMKNTMYDVYKGNQDDYLQCTKSFDVSKQDGISISFMTWVQGDYSNDDGYFGVYYITPYDYLNFEIGDAQGNWVNPTDANQAPFLDWNNANYLQLPGSYYFFDTTWDLYNIRYPTDYTNYVQDMGNGWWKVFFNCSTADLANIYGLDVTDIMFRFSWASDPEYQYEGAYVDCVKVVSIENMEEKVFQSHSEGPFTIPEGCSNFTFPMEWCVDSGAKDNQYDVRLWLEDVDGTHTSLTDWNNYQDIYVIVTDWFDVEVNRIQIESSLHPGWVIDTGDSPNIIPDSDITMNYGDDAHILATIHEDGTLPASNIPVTATAYAKTWKDIVFCDFEGLNPFSQLYGEAHITTKDAWSPTHSLGFFTEEYDQYLQTDTFSYAIGPTVSFYDNVPTYMEFYWKGLTEGTTTSTTDYVNPCLIDNHHNTLVGNNAAFAGNRLGGYQPDWIGPQQPSCRYQRVDLLAIYQKYRDTYGYFYDALGNEMHSASVGFYFTGDGDYYNYNSLARNQRILWSGVYIDNVRIYQQVISTTPTWSQTVIIPGPLTPCQTATAQFQWEGLPYCDYHIVVAANPTGACGNMKHASMSTQIHVLSDLELASNKNMETVDYTSVDNGQFGISTSDYDNYIASNAASSKYTASQNQVMQLCINGTKCISTAGLTHLYMNFDAWYEIENGYDYFYVEVAKCADTHVWTDWKAVKIQPLGTAFITGSSALDGANSDGWFLQSEANGLTCDLLDPTAWGPQASIEVRIHFVSDSGYNLRGIKLDNINIPALGFHDPCDNLNNWCPQAPWSYGTFWLYDSVLNQWCWHPAVAGPYKDGIIWSTDWDNAFMGQFCFSYNNALTAGEVLCQISVDGGTTWYTICQFNQTYRLGAGSYCYDLTPYKGHNNILIRFIAQANPYRYYGAAPWYPSTVSGTFCMSALKIAGKVDNLAPKTTITESGTMKDSGWYTTPVKCTITATDAGGAGMGEIHYILDGVEKVVAGSKADFTVSGNGKHTLEFWGVDAAGNVETPHNIAPAFKIDSGAKPTVAITAPTPGIYFNGKKLMSSSNIIIIGGFDVTATASDAESGVYRVSFYLDGNFVADDTTAPYTVHISSKHTGAATLKVTAEDYAQNTADATLTLKYFKFF